MPVKYLRETPSQTAGPFVHIGLMPGYCGIGGVFPADLGATMITGEARGERITLSGRVIDGTGQPSRDAVVEAWQADAAGLFPEPGETRGAADPHFAGFGRAACSAEDGMFSFATVKPGRVPFGDGRLQAPHVTLWVVARGINIGLHTRAYFADEPDANDEDPVLAAIEHRSRVQTLLAQPDGKGGYRFDIHLQGPDETVFFDV